LSAVGLTAQFAERGRVSPSDYEICAYRPDLLDGVVDCLSSLWGTNATANRRLFEWKHLENPHLDAPLGVVALHGDRVVGFRGFFASRWHIPGETRQFTLLGPCDTVVHSGHRRRNLSVAMGQFAMKEYGSRYKLFLNTTASANSAPGYLRLGFVPLTARAYLRRYSIADLLLKKKVWSERRRRDFYAKNLQFGQSGDVLVAPDAKPESMAAVVERQGGNDRRLTLAQDAAFFRWRFKSGRHYVFYYLLDGDSIRGYAVVSVGQDPMYGTIVDHAEEVGADALEAIVRRILGDRHFGVLSILAQSPGASARRRLAGLGFKPESALVNRLRGRVHPPFLLRPVSAEYSESDWFLAGLDARDPAHWQIKGVSLDAA
jgi:GNAT superfamily N-acetyltransferase